jgi:hypothetical protein
MLEINTCKNHLNTKLLFRILKAFWRPNNKVTLLLVNVVVVVAVVEAGVVEVEVVEKEAVTFEVVVQVVVRVDKEDVEVDDEVTLVVVVKAV